MNPDPLDNLWRSASNQPDTDDTRPARFFLRQLRRRRLAQGIWLLWTFLALSAVTGLAAIQFLRDSGAAMAGQTMLWPLLILPWAAALRLGWRFCREAPGRFDPSLPLPEILKAAEAGNAAERWRLRLIGGLLLVFLPITAGAIWQLHESGKASATEAWSLATFLGLALTGSGAFVGLRYRWRLLPEKRQIAALQNDLPAPENPVAGPTH